MPESLLDAWQMDGPGMIPGRIIDHSIELSLNSPTVKCNVDAHTLLATLAMFPAGLLKLKLDRWAPKLGIKALGAI